MSVATMPTQHHRITFSLKAIKAALPAPKLLRRHHQRKSEAPAAELVSRPVDAETLATKLSQLPADLNEDEPASSAAPEQDGLSPSSPSAPSAASPMSSSP